MRHIKITLQYDGTDYSGWQVQKKEKTIQQIIEDTIYTITGEHVRITGAARTDAGVHALAQVAAFKTQSNLEPQIFLRAINANIPRDIRVISAEECSEDFHPRYSAKNKTYSYLITPVNTFSPTPSPPALEGGGWGRGDFRSPVSSSVDKSIAYSVFLKRYSWQVLYNLNCDLMREAAECLVGTHDFSCFRASGCSSKNPVRTIFKLEIAEFPFINFMNFKFNTPLIKISIQADAFLRHMVRNIVGTLVEVGRGKQPVSYTKEILDLKDRRFSGPAAPAHGLFLEEINYCSLAKFITY